MSKPRIQLQAVIDTEAHANTIIQAVRDKLVGKDIFEDSNLTLSETDDEPRKSLILFDCRFNSRIDRDDVKTWLKDQVQAHPVVKTWVQSVKLTTHLCTHDDVNVNDCKTTEYLVEFER